MRLKQQLHAILAERIMLLDGGMGTMIQQYKLEEEDYRGERYQGHPCSLKGNNDLLSITRPDILKEIHAAYFEAGADFAETNTFSSTSIAQADYQLEGAVYELNLQSAKLAKEVAIEYTKKTPEKPRFVVGSIGPTNRTASMSPDVNDPGFRAVSFQDLVEAYTEQVRGLIDGGADILMVETVFDTLNCKAALFAISSYLEKNSLETPIFVSVTITDQSGRTLSGQTVEAFWNSISHGNIFCVGLNCALGAKELRPYVSELSRVANCYISAHPNAGLPNEFGEYDQTPKEMAEEVGEFIKEKYVNILGGCCGTNPKHIHELAITITGKTPKKLIINNV